MTRKLISRMLDLGTSVSQSDVALVLNLLQATAGLLDSERFSVGLDNFVCFCPGIGRTFDSESAGYQAGRNTVYVNASESSIFNNRFTLAATVEKTPPPSKVPWCSPSRTWPPRPPTRR